MNLTFLNPLFLFGLAAAVLPILIHRLTRRQAITIRFSAVRLLLKSQQIMTRPQRLKHLLLLALRVLAVMGLVFLMAQPFLIRPGILSLGEETPTVLILDNSMSMAYVEDRATRYEIAKGVAKEIISRMRGEIALLPTSSLKSDSQWMSRGDALKELERNRLSFDKGVPASSLSMGYRLLKEMKKPGEILVISDMAQGDWKGFDLSGLGTVPSDTRVNFLRIGSSHRDPNVAVKGLKLIEGEAVVGVPSRLEVTLSNLSDQSRDILIHLYLAGVKRDQKSLILQTRAEGKIYFEVFFDQPGKINGEIRISGDRLPLDDLFPFSLNVREMVKALIVDGDPRTSLKASESYYLVNALQPGGSEGSPFHTKVITEEEFSYLDTKPYDALFLLNVARPQIFKLLPHLESGRPVFIFLGDRVNAGEYNAFPLSPWRMREIKEADSLTITEIDPSRPILKSLSGQGGESLRSAVFHRYLKIEGGAKNLLTLKNRDPLLIEAALGKGKIFLFASSADLDWNDLPVKAAYLPLIQGLLKEAVGLTAGSISDSTRMGDPSGEKRGLEESDLTKMRPEEMRKRFGKIDVRVVEYREEALKSIHSGRKELWPLLLGFVLLVLAIEMVVAGRI